MNTAIILDKIQKNIKITKEEYEVVKKQKLVEGRFPSIYISSGVSEVIQQKEIYIKNKGFDDEYYKDLIIKFLQEYGKATRQEIDNLLINKLSDILTENQKKRKIKYLLEVLSTNDGQIETVGQTKSAYWQLKK